MSMVRTELGPSLDTRCVVILLYHDYPPGAESFGVSLWVDDLPSDPVTEFLSAGVADLTSLVG